MSHVPALVEAYLDHLRVERRLAAHSLESYARDLAGLAAFAAGAGRPLESLDRQALELFVREQRTRGLAPRSVARSVAAVRGFYRFLVLDRRLDSSPADDLRPPRAWPSLPNFLSIDEVDRLIAQADVTKTLGLRDRAMIELLYATGLRVSELVGVRLADLHLDDHYLTCVGKGSKERLVPIGEQATEWIRKYSTRARRELGFSPQVGVREGVRRAIASARTGPPGLACEYGCSGRRLPRRLAAGRCGEAEPDAIGQLVQGDEENRAANSQAPQQAD
jgi:integrase/recombinase XerD